jgi:hypothetical protein
LPHAVASFIETSGPTLTPPVPPVATVVPVMFAREPTETKLLAKTTWLIAEIGFGALSVIVTAMNSLSGSAPVLTGLVMSGAADGAAFNCCCQPAGSAAVSSDVVPVRHEQRDEDAGR